MCGPPEEGRRWEPIAHDCLKDVVHKMHTATQTGWGGTVFSVASLDVRLLSVAQGHVFPKDVIRPHRLKVLIPFSRKELFPVPILPFGKEIIGINIDSLYSFLT